MIFNSLNLCKYKNTVGYTTLVLHLRQYYTKLYKMKKLFAFTFALLIATVSFAQQKNIVAKIKKEKGTFVQTNNGSVTTFQLSTSYNEIEKLKAKADELSDKMTLKVDAIDNTNFTCVLSINHQNHAEYVHKMFVYLGITSITVDGVEKPLDDLIATLKGLR